MMGFVFANQFTLSIARLADGKAVKGFFTQSDGGGVSRLRLKPVSYCRFKYIKVYIFQHFELNAIPGHACLPKFFTIRLG